MTHGAPAQQDKPTPTLPLLDEVLDLAPALEAEWPAIRATIPAGTPVNDGGEGEGGEEPGGETATGPDTGQPGGEEESFYDFDPSQIPQGKDPVEWVGEQYGEMRKAFTQKTQGIAETRREAEETQALIDGLRDPETAPHYIRLLGYDLADPAVQQHFGISAAAAADELDALLEDDEPATDERVAALEAQLEQQKKDGEAAAYEQALDDLADQELEQIEEQWGRKLSEEEDEILRLRAERNPDAQGLPDYATAARVLKSVLNNGVEQELQRRREPGRGAPGGKPGGKTLDPSKREDRIALAAAAAERAKASEN